MKRGWIVALFGMLLIASPAPALAQQVDSTQSSSTVSVTNTFQQVLPQNDTRRGCTVQNKGSNNMFVFFGPIASATTNNSFLLLPAAGNSVSCNLPGGTIRSQVSITGTGGDRYVFSEQ